jgi:type II secretory pathway component GspD/PulD (secretin)
MNRTLCAVLLSLFVLTLHAPALAQNATAKKVTLDLNGVAPAAAFKAVADAIGVSVTVDAAVTDPVDITVRNVSAKTALNAVCESIGCRWTLTGKTLVVTPETAVKVGVVMRGERGAAVDKTAAKARAQVVLAAFKQKLPSDMNFENAPLDVVNKRLSEALNMNVQLTCKDATVQTLTLDFSDRTLQEALKSLGEQEVRPNAAWRMTIGPFPGDTQTPSIAIMVGPKTVKKTVAKR